MNQNELSIKRLRNALKKSKREIGYLNQEVEHYRKRYEDTKKALTKTIAVSVGAVVGAFILLVISVFV